MNSIAPRPAKGKTDEKAIIEAVCRVWGVCPHDVLGRTRRQPVAFARQLAMALTYRMTSYSLNEVGGIFGRDHGTVIYANKIIDRNMDNPVVKDDIKQVLNIIQKP